MVNFMGGSPVFTLSDGTELHREDIIGEPKAFKDVEYDEATGKYKIVVVTPPPAECEK